MPRFISSMNAAATSANQIKPGVDLTIPEGYQILDQTFLMPFWEEFDFSSGYWENALKNVVSSRVRPAGVLPLCLLFVEVAWQAGGFGDGGSRVPGQRYD